MKIAITSHGQNRNAAVDSRFGRADYFVLYDQESDTWTSLSNTQNLEAAHGAGIQAGQSLEKTEASVLITGHVGPKAFKLLDAANITMYSFGDFNGTVDEALRAFLDGKLSSINSPGAMGHGK
ncbi:NifB/NifX family molybdenum-iron cluster-binding protein [Sporomusa malonica]|uniref:Predicted Fe-Mo cluster-binding protein, NifX family n=1 Tax=Sporomusa malonica TaxID=112901 RepID=A0A1W2EQ86_9FIRM|nr:NifB/NifX family molybdenum-iron cluster-binding protein [Sporomusa malonica]SMD11416.1 Predicted Fe-Mo cluster-binding protein, NifX family [Sporomusa malonica]